MISGYTYCACRDCFEVTVSDDTDNPDLCLSCKEAGCEPGKECQGPHAYGGDYAWVTHEAFVEAIHAVSGIDPAAPGVCWSTLSEEWNNAALEYLDSNRDPALDPAI